MRVQVGIVGAGPAGLVLGLLLARAGIETMLIENRSRQYVESRVRAGLLEHVSVELLKELGVADRLEREGLVHHGVHLRYNGKSHRLPYEPGVTMTIYAQQECVKDLIAARIAAGDPIEFDVRDVSVQDIDSKTPRIRYVDRTGAQQEIACDFIAGCDGFHGVCRDSIPPGVLTVYDREYPYGWLGILADAPPLEPELVYTNHERGFALFTMRSLKVARNYFQVPPDEDIATWSDERIWEEFRLRLGGENEHTLVEGRITKKEVTPMRSFLVTPMQYGRLFLAGDAAHIVPPTGAKGMNLAIGDVAVLAERFIDYYETGSQGGLDGYSDAALDRVWQAQRFSWWLTQLMHRPAGETPFAREMQRAELDYVTGSLPGRRSLVDNYTGLPHGTRASRA